MNEDGIWQRMLRRKYLASKTFSEVQKKPGDSQFWRGLMNVKDQLISFGRFNLQNGTQIRFWEDKWQAKGTISYLI